MNETEEKMCLDNIEEFLMDHNKIVTYKYLSRSLNISTFDAKRLIAKYASTFDQKSDLSAVYAVGGELKNNEGYSVIIAEDKDLDAVKTQFEKVSWEQLYSLQKKGQLSDLNTLHIVNNGTPTDENENSVVGIPYWKDPKRDDIAARNAATSSAPTIVKQEPKVAPKKVVSPQKAAPKTPPKTPPKAVSKSKTSPSPKKETTAKDKNAGNKSGGIAAMFAAQQSKKDTAPKSKAKSEPAKKGSQGSQGSISSFFLGQSKAPAKKAPEKKAESSAEVTSSCPATADNTKSKSESQEMFSSSDVEKDSQKSKESQESVPKVNRKGGSSQASKNVKNPAAIKKKAPSQKSKKAKPSEPPQKRRKRVMMESDSEDSSKGDSDAESERSISPELEKPPSPEPMEEDEEIIPATPVEPSKKRKRRAVDKTVMDENGFLCTTKEYVMESCSDDEENDENKKTNANSDAKEAPKPEKSPEPKKVTKQPTKQVSLTNFFKKK